MIKEARATGWVAAGALFAALAAGCSDGNHHHDYGGMGGMGAVGTPVPADDAGSGTPAPAGDGGASAKPLLVDVDPNQTLTATPGDGAGVFVEYQTGGHWHVWWTCDTNKTSESCAYDVTVSVASGAITNARAETTTTLQASGAAVHATSTTTTGTDGIWLDTAPGATITLDAAIGGVRDGRLLFFVQNGKINGGYTGVVTDPLMLEPSSP